jgi:hypothetical protein
MNFSDSLPKYSSLIDHPFKPWLNQEKSYAAPRTEVKPKENFFSKASIK